MRKSVRIITFTGRPGSGKSTIVKNVLLARPRMRIFAGKSVTTRPRRKGDVKGEYKHVSPEQFAALEAREEFLWTIEHSGYRYGTRKADIDKALRARKVSIMTLVPECVKKLRVYAGGERVTSFFIHVPEPLLFYRMTALRGDVHPQAFARLTETAQWSHTLDMILVGNVKDELEPAKTATEAVLKMLPKC